VLHFVLNLKIERSAEMNEKLKFPNGLHCWTEMMCECKDMAT
jgi:hypothetical protein